MKESISYTVLLNIMITFIVIVFAFLSAIIIYFKSNKVGNLITSSIEKYAGYNSGSQKEINSKLLSIGYNVSNIKCSETVNDKNAIKTKEISEDEKCKLVSSKDNVGYCIYLCLSKNSHSDEEYYYYKIRTNMPINIPIINDLLNLPIYTNTNEMYNFGCKFSNVCIGK